MAQDIYPQTQSPACMSTNAFVTVIFFSCERSSDTYLTQKYLDCNDDGLIIIPTEKMLSANKDSANMA
jgi:hypothetical protein